MRKIICWLIMGSVGLFFVAATGHGATEDLYYKGKMIRIIVGLSPGGAFDAYSRGLSRHMGKYIPGNPSIVVDNMPGGGSLIAANHLYKVSKPDGLTIGNFSGPVLRGRVLGQKGIEFDARKFEYIGTPVRFQYVCVLSKASGITDIDKWFASKIPVKMGGIGLGVSTDNVIKVVRAALGLPIQLVSGYKGMSDIRLATESGEVAGTCFGPRAVWRRALDAGEVIPVLQVTPKPAPDFPNVPLAINLAKTEEARKLIELGVHDDSAISSMYMMPPGTPKELVAMLRRAMMDTIRDGEFLAEMKKASLEVDPLGGEEAEKIINDFFKLDAELIGKLKEIYYK